MKLAIIVMVSGLAALAADSGMELYQKAVTQERAGKMEEAIKLYEKVAHDFASDRALAAKALVQAARGYEKLGQDGAQKLYERVAREYADQRESAQAAREKLAALRQAETPAMTMRKIEFGENVKDFVGTDGVRAVYWDATNALVLGDIAGKNKTVIYQAKPKERPAAHVSRDLSMVFLDFPAAHPDAVIKSDGTGYREIGTFTPLPGPSYVEWSWDNRQLVIVDRSSLGVYQMRVVSLDDGSIRGIVTGDFLGEPRFSPDGRYIGYTTGGTPSAPLLVVAARGGQPKPVGAGFILDWTRDGHSLLSVILHRGTATSVVAIPIKDGGRTGEPVLVPADLPGFGFSVGRTGTGGVLAVRFISGERTVFLGALDASDRLGLWKPLKLLSDAITPNGTAAALSPDATRIAYPVHDPRTFATSIRLQNVLTGEDRELARADGAVLPCVWAMRRPALFCATWTDAGSDFLSVALDSGRVEKIWSAEGAVWPRWISSDDRVIWMRRLAGPRSVLWEVATQRETLLPRGFMQSSPDGRWHMRFFTDSQNRRAIQIRPASAPTDTDEWKHLAFLRIPGPRVVGPTAGEFTRDGNWFVYQDRDENGKDGLYRVSTSGGEPERLGDYPTTQESGLLDISEDGRHFLAVPYVQRGQVELWALENFLPKQQPAR